MKLMTVQYNNKRQANSLKILVLYTKDKRGDSQSFII